MAFAGPASPMTHSTASPGSPLVSPLQRICECNTGRAEDGGGEQVGAVRQDLGRPDELELATAVAQPILFFATFAVGAYRSLFRIHGHY